jgi:hypothetical protein
MRPAPKWLPGDIIPIVSHTTHQGKSKKIAASLLAFIAFVAQWVIAMPPWLRAVLLLSLGLACTWLLILWSQGIRQRWLRILMIGAGLVVVIPFLWSQWSGQCVEHKFPFPWIAVSHVNLSGKDLLKLQVVVRDFPLVNPDAGGITLSHLSLFHIDLIVSQVVSVSTNDESWYGIVVHRLKEEEWNTRDGDFRELPIVELAKPTSVIEFEGQTRNAIWNGYLIVTNKRGRIEKSEAIRGTITLSSGETRKLELTEAVYWENGILRRTRSYTFEPLSKSNLLSYGVPIRE